MLLGCEGGRYGRLLAEFVWLLGCAAAKIFQLGNASSSHSEPSGQSTVSNSTRGKEVCFSLRLGLGGVGGGAGECMLKEEGVGAC